MQSTFFPQFGAAFLVKRSWLCGVIGAEQLSCCAVLESIHLPALLSRILAKKKKKKLRWTHEWVDKHHVQWPKRPARRTRTRWPRRGRDVCRRMCVSQPGGVKKSRTSKEDKKTTAKKKRKKCLTSEPARFFSFCVSSQTGQERFIALLQSFLELFNGELTDLRAAVCFLPLQSILNPLDGSYVLCIQRLPSPSRSISRRTDRPACVSIYMLLHDVKSCMQSLSLYVISPSFETLWHNKD